jgi:hypothetical protein
LTEQEKKARARRLAQNKGVKAGTVRTGAGGKYVRKYNATTGRWEKIGAAKGSGYGRRTSISASQASKAESRRSKPVTLTGGQKPPGAPASSATTKLGAEGRRASQKVVRVGSTVKTKPGRFVKPTQKTPNRPVTGKPMQLVKERSGKQRWVTYVPSKKTGKK